MRHIALGDYARNFHFVAMSRGDVSLRIRSGGGGGGGCEQNTNPVLLFAWAFRDSAVCIADARLNDQAHRRTCGQTALHPLRQHSIVLVKMQGFGSARVLLTFDAMAPLRSL